MNRVYVKRGEPQENDAENQKSCISQENSSNQILEQKLLSTYSESDPWSIIPCECNSFISLEAFAGDRANLSTRSCAPMAGTRVHHSMVRRNMQRHCERQLMAFETTSINSYLWKLEEISVSSSVFAIPIQGIK